MPRRIVVTALEIQKRRAQAWEDHYRNRMLARALITAGTSAEIAIRNLELFYPAPEIGVDGYALDIPLVVRREHNHRMRLPADLLCVWYWSESYWMEFVRKYQSLPDVYEDYYWKYEPEPLDRGVLVPVSSKPKQGTKKVQLPDFPLVHARTRVDNRVDK